MKVSEKIDRQGARTPADIEQKYNFGKSFAEVMGVAKDARNSAETAQKSVTELDEKLTADEIFTRLTKDGIFQGIFKDEDGKYYINAEVLKAVDSLFSKDINLTGTLTHTVKAFLEPEEQERETVRNHLLGRVTIPDELIPLYDFNNDGTVTGVDMAQIQLSMLGRKSLAEWAGEDKKTDVTLILDLKNPNKFLTVKGKNIWGREVEKYIGANLTNIMNSDIADYVVETGGEGIWDYEKWASGKVVCWGTHYYDEVAINKAWGNLYVSAELSAPDNFPSLLFPYANPTCVNISAWDTGGLSLFVVNSSQVPSRDNVGTFQLARPTSGTASYVKVDFYIIGQWK